MLLSTSPTLRASLLAHRWRIVLFGLVALLAIVLGFWTFTPMQAVYGVRAGGYFVTLVAAALFGFYVYRLLREARLADRWRAGGWKIAGLIFGVSAVMHLQEPHGFKIVNDELVQLSTSQRMHELREMSTVVRGFQLGTEFMPMQGHVDKRPMFYPFLLSVVHDVTGYRPENVFLLNGLLTPVLLGLVYLIGRVLVGVGGGVAGVLLLSTLPLLVQSVTGGGFEVLNLVMIAGTLFLGLLFARRPDKINLSAFCLSGVLLAQVRYESVLFLFPTSAAILYVFWRTQRIELPWAVIVAPLLLVVYPLQLNVFELRPEMWQLSDRPSEAGVYSWGYFYDNLGRALAYFLSLDQTQPNSHLIAAAGVVGVSFFVLHLWRENRAILRGQPEQAVFSIFMVALLGQAVLMLCYFWGAYDDPLTVRLSLPTQLACVIAFVFVWPLLVRAELRWTAVGVVAAGYFFCWTAPTVAQRAYAQVNFVAETANWLREFIKAQPDRRFIVVEPTMPMLWLTHGVASVSFESLGERPEQFAYHHRWKTFSDYFVVQKLEVGDTDPVALAPMRRTDLGDALELETVRKIVFRPNYVIRISRIVALDEERLKRWSESRTQLGESTSPPADAKRRNEELVQEWLINLP